MVEMLDARAPVPALRPPHVVVVLPAYNESAVIGRLLHGVHATLLTAGYPDHELLVVDDGSQDDTAERVVAVQEQDQLPVTLLRHERNQGLGRALRTGLVAARDLVGERDVVLTTEADGTQPLEVLPQLVRAVEEGCDLAVGSPLRVPGGFRGVRWHRRLLSRGANILYAGLFPMHPLADYTILVRALNGGLLRRAVDAYGTRGLIARRGFEGVPELVLKLRPLCPRIEELPLTIDHTRLRRRSQMPILRTIRASLALIAQEMAARAQRRMGDL